MATYYIYKLTDGEKSYNYVTKQNKFREALRVQRPCAKYKSLFGNKIVDCICLSSFKASALEDAKKYLIDYEKRAEEGKLLEPEEDYLDMEYERLLQDDEGDRVTDGRKESLGNNCEECESWGEISDICSEKSSSSEKSGVKTEPVDDCVFFCCDCGVAVPPQYRELHLDSAGHAMVQEFIKNRNACLVE